MMRDVFARRLLHSDALSPTQCRIGLLLLEMVPADTGVLALSIDALVDLAGTSRATVFRALTGLCAPNGPFIRVPHGGLAHENAYIPNWLWGARR